MSGKYNGGQEFGELKATVQALAKTQDEFRAETRDMRREILDAFKTMKSDQDKKDAETARLIEKNADQIEGLKKWRWYLTGGAVTGGAGLAHLVKLFHS